MFNKFPREVGTERKVVQSKEEMIEWINTNNGYKNCFTSVYKFNEINTNDKGWMKPDYYSAVVDKGFFDYDIEVDGTDRDDAYESRMEALKALRRFHKWAKNEGVKHAMFISGGGFHSYVATGYDVLQYKKHALQNLQQYIVEECNLKIDRTVLGDLSQITRIPNTWNPKRERFCVPITPDEVMNLNPDELFELAESQRPDVDPVVPGKKINLENFDQNKVKNMYQDKKEGVGGLVDEEIDVENMEIDVNALNPPESIRYIINSDGAIDHDQRYLLITFFKAKGLTEEQCAKVMKDILSKQKYYHCTQEEVSHLPYGQISYLYGRDYVFFPNPETIRNKYGLPISGKRSEKEKVYKKPGQRA